MTATIFDCLDLYKDYTPRPGTVNGKGFPKSTIKASGAVTGG
jgi:hypothetical protein